MTLTIALAALLGISESLALIPAIKANSILQLVINTLKSITGASGASP
jgi:hypothetical protein